KYARGVACREVCDELRVDPLGERDRARSEPSSPRGDAPPARASVGIVHRALDEALALEVAQHLRRHLDVDPRLCSQCDLARTLALLVEPPGAGQQHELDVREVE